MRFGGNRPLLALLRFAPLLLFALLFVSFGVASDRFLTVVNLRNIVTQASHTAIMAIGMTFTLLVRGVDLSVGSAMYLAAVVLGLYLRGLPLALAMPVLMLIGCAFGALNAVFVTRLRIAPFIVTLSALFIGRGLALWLSDTKDVYQSDLVLRLGRDSALGVPWAIWFLLAVVAVAWSVLTQTPYGRQIYAVGADPEAAAKAGIRVRSVVFSVYCICSVCAVIGGVVSVSQVGSASATFGYQEEFPVIAAAVLGGTSLFGGRGGVLGSVFGAILVQTTENGLVMLDANPYLYPLVVAGIIFLAALLDGRRTALVERLERRTIRVE
jgi:ribose transport system permease protein